MEENYHWVDSRVRIEMEVEIDDELNDWEW
jgi:hypothetical protein